jgi:hypothetical protein
MFNIPIIFFKLLKLCKSEKIDILHSHHRYFDFIDVEDVKKIVEEYCLNGGQKFYNLTYPGPKLKLSEWAVKFGATSTIAEADLDEPYISELKMNTS